MLDGINTNGVTREDFANGVPPTNDIIKGGEHPIVAGTENTPAPLDERGIPTVDAYTRVRAPELGEYFNTLTNEHFMVGPKYPNEMVTIQLPAGKEVGVYRSALPASELDKVFTKEFEDYLEPFEVIRVLDAIGAVKNSQGNTPMTAISWANAAPIEPYAELCARKGKKLWVTLPHNLAPAAVGGYVQGIKQSGIPPNDVFIEFSNECWNGQFDQTGWTRSMGNADTEIVELTHKYLGWPEGSLTNLRGAMFCLKELVRYKDHFIAAGMNVKAVFAWHFEGEFPIFGDLRWDPNIIPTLMPDYWKDVDALATGAYITDPTKWDSSVASWKAGAEALGLPVMSYEYNSHKVGNSEADVIEGYDKLAAAGFSAVCLYRADGGTTFPVELTEVWNIRSDSGLYQHVAGQVVVDPPVEPEPEPIPDEEPTDEPVPEPEPTPEPEPEPDPTPDPTPETPLDILLVMDAIEALTESMNGMRADNAETKDTVDRMRVELTQATESIHAGQMRIDNHIEVIEAQQDRGYALEGAIVPVDTPAGG